MTATEAPWQHGFPPFYTLQPNLDTRKKQLACWGDLVVNHCRQGNQFLIDAQDAVFSNEQISRRLGPEGVNSVMEHLRRAGRAEPVDGRWLILWHTLPEWAAMLYSWAKGRLGAVCTLYEITSSPEFAAMEEALLLKIIAHLQRQQRAELIVMEDAKGVKFF